MTYVAQNRNSYSLKDISSYLESLDISGNAASTGTRHSKITNNNDPNVLEKHTIEVKVNELLAKKLEEELKAEREVLSEEKAKVNKEMDKYSKANEELSIKLKNAEKILQADNLDQVDVKFETFESKTPEYIKKVYSFNSRETEEKTFDPNKNELVILSSVQDTFGHKRTFQDFFDLFRGLKDIPESKISISLLISEPQLFKIIDTYINDGFKEISKVKKLSELKQTFSKITLLHAPFLEEKFKVNRALRQKASVQKQRRKVLAQMRNFLLNNGINNEKYSLFIDSDVIKFPPEMLKVFIDSNKDIATVRVDMMNSDGVAVHPDYDLNSWAGDRIKPTVEEEEKIDSDPDYLFTPKPGPNKVQFLDLSANKEKYGLNNDKSSAYPLVSVGGAILFAKSEVYKLGINFPPYYAVGTTWDRIEGWDGVETEGLCYQAKSIGYQCWGFPNLIAYHTTKVN